MVGGTIVFSLSGKPSVRHYSQYSMLDLFFDSTKVTNMGTAKYPKTCPGN